MKMEIRVRMRMKGGISQVNDNHRRAVLEEVCQANIPVQYLKLVELCQGSEGLFFVSLRNGRLKTRSVQRQSKAAEILAHATEKN